MEWLEAESWLQPKVEPGYSRPGEHSQKGEIGHLRSMLSRRW